MTISHTSFLALVTSIFLLSLATVSLAQEDSDQGEAASSVETSTAEQRVQASSSNSAESRINLSDRPATPEELEAGESSNRVEARAEFASTSAERRAEVQANVDQRKIALQVRAQERVTNLAANMSNRMEAAINRLQNVSGRIESRIEKLKARGVVTAGAENALASAQVSLNAALAEIATIDADVQAAVSSQNARAGWNQVKAKFFIIRDHITTAHTELRASVAALKLSIDTQASAQTNQAQLPDCPDDLPAVGEPGYDPMQFVDCSGSEALE